jgi:hypothetical protein
LSAYVLHTIPLHWPNAVPELLATFQPHNLPAIPSERTAWILLEILTVLPEEVMAVFYFLVETSVLLRQVIDYCTIQCEYTIRILEDFLHSVCAEQCRLMMNVSFLHRYYCRLLL